MTTAEQTPAVEPPAGGPVPAQHAKWFVAVVAIAAIVALFWPRGEGTFDAPGGFLLDVRGRPTPLAPRLAPVTLLHFWATWCPPCLTEIPALDRLAADSAQDMKFSVVMVAVDDTTEKVRTFRGNEAEDILFDSNWEVADRYGTDKLPETYLIVRGKVVHKFVGATDWDDPEVRQMVERALVEL
jgi:thiol-disulfide isomerase/thioredoxin